jgi:hypothetical protein
VRGLCIEIQVGHREFSVMHELVARLEELNKQWIRGEIENENYAYEVQAITVSLKLYAEIIENLTSQVDDFNATKEKDTK